jgi:hypothetical protein
MTSDIAPISAIVPLDLLPGPVTNMLAHGVAVAPTANRVYAMAFQVHRPRTVSAVRVVVGTQSGNLAIAIHDSAGVQLTTSGSVAVGAAGAQSVAVTAVTLVPGVKYFMCVQIDNTTARLAAVAASGTTTTTLVAVGFYYTVDTTFPIPTPLTFASAAAVTYVLAIPV